jgi:hypothetical protein
VSPRAGEAAFGCTLSAFFPLLLALVHRGCSARRMPASWTWRAVAVVSTVPTVGEVAGSGYVDLALAVYAFLAIRTMAHWWSAGGAASLAVVSLALGFALSVKLTASFLVLILVVFVVVKARATGALLPGVAAVAGAVLLGCPWYLRTWARTGNPVFPFFANLWPGHAAGWDPERSALLHQFNALYGGSDKGPFEYLWTPIRLSLMGQREIALFYEGVLGVSFVLGAALLLWAAARRAVAADLGVAAAAGGAFFLWWLVSAQVLRYLLPALAPLAVAIAGSGAILERQRAVGPVARWGLVVSTVACLTVGVGWFVGDDPVSAASGAEPRAAYLDRRLEYHPYYRVINGSLPVDARVWLVDVRRDTYHLERPYVGDYLFEDYTLRQWLGQARSGAEVRQRALAEGITHVLIRHDVLFDRAQSPLIDDRLPHEENVARVERLRSLLSDGTRVLRADRRYALVELVSRGR